MSGQLPSGWSAAQTHDGRWYYYNTAQKITQWHPPSAAPVYPSYPPMAPTGYPPQQHVPPGRYAPQKAPTGYPQNNGSQAPQSYPSGAGGSSHSGSASAGSGGRYTHNTAMSYKLREKAFSLSGDAFQIKNTVTGETAFKVKGNVLSLKDSKKLLDSSGHAIYTMSESLFSLRGRMAIVDSGTKQPVATLRKKSFIPMMGTGTIQVWRGGSDDGAPWLEVKGDFFRKNFNFVDKSTGNTVASVKRKGFNMSNILLEKDTYVLRVEPGVDSAIMVFLVVAVDEMYRDDGNRTGYESRLGGLF